MQYIDRLLEPYRVYRAKRVALEALDDFKHTLPVAPPGFRFRISAAQLRQPERVTNIAPRRPRKCQQILFRQCYPFERLLTRHV